MKRYDRYKDSGIEWLGEIPDHWDIIRLKFVAHTKMGQSPSSDKYTFDEELQPFLQGNAEFGSVYPNPRFYCDNPPKSAPQNSILISVRAPVGAVNIADQEYGIGRGLCAIVPDNQNLFNEYAWYLSFVTRHELWSIATGSTYEAVSVDEVSSMTLPVPSKIEQRSIASFLDRETGRIDKLIEKKQRQIELLKEKRASLISHVVTGKMEVKKIEKENGTITYRVQKPSYKMKESGIEWLGKIPEHWGKVRFKYALLLQRGYDLPTTEFCEGKYPVFGSNGCIGYHNHFTTKGPGVTIGRSGSVGEVNYVEMDYWAHNTALYVKEFRRAIPKFAFYLLKSLDVKYLSEGTAVGTLNRNYIHDLQIPIPKTEIQKNLCIFLDCETSRIDKLIEKVQRSIEMLREYRTALISAAVTGKIDVRKEVS